MSNSVRRLAFAVVGAAAFATASVEVHAQTSTQSTRQIPTSPRQAAEQMRQRAEAARVERERVEQQERVARERAERARAEQRSERDRARDRGEWERARAERERRGAGSASNSCAPGLARAAQTPAGPVLARVFGPGGPASHARPGCRGEDEAKNDERGRGDGRGAARAGAGNRRGEANRGRGRQGGGR